jgi:5-aminolevulinate synthase
VQPINYPTVPVKGTERLRFTPTPMHSDRRHQPSCRARNELWSQCALAEACAAQNP